MNREESIERFKQGREAWNAWAADMLAEREALEQDHRWLEEGTDYKLTEEAKRWHEKAAADFSSQPFEGKADFSRYSFPGQVNFGGVIFKDAARFDGATFRVAARFSSTTFRDAAEFYGVTFRDDAGFDSVTFRGTAGFDGATFRDAARFGSTTFRDAAEFDGATFRGTAGFCDAIFRDAARFDGAIFRDAAEFYGVTFRGTARFYGAIFRDAAEFYDAVFRDAARFHGVTFRGTAGFDGAIFRGTAGFDGIDSLRAFSLANGKFLAVPDFIQARFSEAPRCDNISIATGSFWSRLVAHVKWQFKRNPEAAGSASASSIKENENSKPPPLFQKADPDLPARWRALKRLAIQGHDNEHEQMFFKEELVARRWHVDQPWHAAFWFAALYGLLSDYGRSLLRPLFGWTLCAAVFAAVYLSQHPAFQAPQRSFLDRLVAFEITTMPLHCEQGDDNPVSAAFDLSVRNALLFVGQTSRDKLQQNYACLYGQETRVTHFVVFMEHLQNVISAVLIFLFLLGVRNHFKIK